MTVANPPSLWEVVWLNLRTALRQLWRRLRGSCMGCGTGHRLPGRQVCNSCSMFNLRAFGLGGGK